MTPEEKANELIEKFREYVKDLRVYEYEAIFSKKEETENATQCAIIAVEEIIKANPVSPTDGYYKTTIAQIEDVKQYWRETLSYLKSIQQLI